MLLTYLREEWGGGRFIRTHMVGLIGTAQQFCKVVIPIYISTTSSIQDSYFPISLTTLGIDFSILALLVMCTCGFSLHLADDSWCSAPFHIFAGYLDRLFCKAPVQVFSPFFYWVVCLCTVEILYVFWIRMLCQIIYKDYVSSSTLWLILSLS